MMSTAETGDSAADLAGEILARLQELDTGFRSIPPPRTAEILSELVARVVELCRATGRGGEAEGFVERCEPLLDGVADDGDEGRARLGQVRELIATEARFALREYPAEPAGGGVFGRLVVGVPLAVLLVLVVFYIFSGATVGHNEMQIFWRTSADKFGEDRSQRLCARMDGDWQTFDFSTRGDPVAVLRIDPVSDGLIASRIELRALDLYSAEGAAPAAYPVAGGICTGCTQEAVGDAVGLIPEDADPWLELPAFPERGLQEVRVEARIEPAILWPWTWARAWFSGVVANCAAGLPSRPTYQPPRHIPPRP